MLLWLVMTIVGVSMIVVFIIRHYFVVLSFMIIRWWHVNCLQEYVEINRLKPQLRGEYETKELGANKENMKV